MFRPTNQSAPFPEEPKYPASAVDSLSTSTNAGISNHYNLPSPSETLISSDVYNNMHQQKQYQQQQYALTSPASSWLTSPKTATSNTAAGAASQLSYTQRQNGCGSGYNNDQSLDTSEGSEISSDLTSPTSISKSPHNSLSSEMNISDSTGLGALNSSSSGDIRKHLSLQATSSIPITSNSSSSEARSSNYCKKSLDLGAPGLRSSVSSPSVSALPFYVSPASSTPSGLSPQKRKFGSINFSISNGRAIVSTLDESPPPSDETPIPSPTSSVGSSKSSSFNDSETILKPRSASKKRADDAIIALKQVIARSRPRAFLQTRSRAKSVPATVDNTRPSVDPITATSIPTKKRICSIVNSPHAPPLSPSVSVVGSPQTSRSSPGSISGISSLACDSASSKHGSPSSERAPSPLYVPTVHVLRGNEEGQVVQPQLYIQSQQLPAEREFPITDDPESQYQQHPMHNQVQYPLQQHFLQQQQQQQSQSPQQHQHQQMIHAQQLQISSQPNLHSPSLMMQPQLVPAMVPIQPPTTSSMPTLQHPQQLDLASVHSLAQPPEGYYTMAYTNQPSQYQVLNVQDMDHQLYISASSAFSAMQSASSPTLAYNPNALRQPHELEYQQQFQYQQHQQYPQPQQPFHIAPPQFQTNLQ